MKERSIYTYYIHVAYIIYTYYIHVVYIIYAISTQCTVHSIYENMIQYRLFVIFVAIFIIYKIYYNACEDMMQTNYKYIIH